MNHGVNKGDMVDVLCVTRDGKIFSESFKVAGVIETTNEDYIVYLEDQALRDSSPVSVRSITIRHAVPTPLRF